MTNTNRDYPTPLAEYKVKVAGERCAEAYACGKAGQLAQRERELVAELVAAGMLTPDESTAIAVIEYDGVQAPDSEYYHHVYVYLDLDLGTPNAQTKLVLDITCDA